jgi:uncharacterized coiled-coil DUF342 family protein
MPSNKITSGARPAGIEEPVTAAHPDLDAEMRNMMASLRAQKEKILARTQHMRAERTMIQEQIGPLEARIRELTAEINRIERPHTGILDNQIASLARALGARSMSEGPG